MQALKVHFEIHMKTASKGKKEKNAIDNNLVEICPKYPPERKDR